MLKFSHIFLTIALSFFSLYFNNIEESFAFFKVEHSTQKHQLQNSRLYNACAIATNNTFEDVLNLNTEHENLAELNFTAHRLGNSILFNTNTNYLKTCSLIDLSFTIKAIIFPFHSFL